VGFTPLDTRSLVQRVGPWLELLRWHKPSGRLILLIPAGWALWLSPASPPDPALVGWIVSGGLAVSGAGCIANDLWDRKIDPRVERTKGRPLASGRVGPAGAWGLLALCLTIALMVLLALPGSTRTLCVVVALACLPLVLLYPSAKRWFPLPQLVLAFCWGFAVLIPWAASGGGESFISGRDTLPLSLTWLAAVVWTFGFDTVYAMSDREDDRRIGIRSSALTLGDAAPGVVALAYGITALCLAGAAHVRGIATLPFWCLWGVAACAMQRESAVLRQSSLPRGAYGSHFSHQVLLGGLLLLSLVVGRAGA
jgi:4-hydroxybenzoate polyprenyltransferase